MVRKCEGLPNSSLTCASNAYKSSKYCQFHLWWIRNYPRVNRAIREAKRTGSGFNELFDGVDKSDSVPVNLGPYKIDPHEHGEHEREEAKPEAGK